MDDKTRSTIYERHKETFWVTLKLETEICLKEERGRKYTHKKIKIKKLKIKTLFSSLSTKFVIEMKA